MAMREGTLEAGGKFDGASLGHGVHPFGHSHRRAAVPTG